MTNTSARISPSAAILSAMLVAPALLLPAPVLAQDEEKPPRRTRIALGPQLVPSFPGSDSHSLRPLIDVSRAREGENFKFEAPDESFGFALFKAKRFSAGPSLGFEGSRTAEEVGAALPKVGATFEVGGFAQYDLSDTFRVRTELRKGLGGHKGIIANVSADYVIRDGDRYLFALGPRVTLADDRYQDAFFSVAPQYAVASGLPAYSADGGIQAVGAAAAYITQLSPRWGIYGYARYDRLVGDAADSPIVRNLGSSDQLSGGVALTYTFGR